MKYTFKLFWTLVMLCIFASAHNAAATTVNGHTFDSNSATLTNSYYTLDKHFFWLREDAQLGIIQYIIDKEIIAGVECAKICHSNEGIDYVWLAQDINGNIFLFKGLTGGYDWHDSDNGDTILLWISNAPTVGDHLYGYIDTVPFYQEIVDDNATFGAYTGCVKSKRIADDDREWEIYFKSGLGIVGFSYRDNTSSPWIGFNRVYDTTGQAEHPPAILPKHWVGAHFRSEYYDGSNHVDMKHEVAFVDRDGFAPIGSHYVTMTFPEGSTWNVQPDSISNNYAYHWTSNTISSSFSGTMTYHVYDVAGNKSPPFYDEASYGAVPIVDYATIYISPDGTTPTINWNPPVADNQESAISHYRVRLSNPGQGRSFFGDYTKETSYKIPPGILLPNTQYQVAIEARAEHDGQKQNTLSRSARVSFTTDHVTQTPYTNLSFYAQGIQVYYSPCYEAPQVSFYLRVHDAQGVPGNIDAVTVQVPGVGSRPLFFQGNASDTEGIYRTHYYASVPTGEYTFTIVDKDGHIFSTNENLVPQPLPAVSKSSMSPPNNSVISEDSVTFSWDPVEGASLYELGIIDSEGNWVDSFSIAASSNPQLTIGRGFFEKYHHYRWMINAWDGFWDQLPQNFSEADWNQFGPSIMNGRLNGSNKPSISLAGAGTFVNTIEGPDPSTTNYWLNHYIRVVDADGAPGNIAAVTVTYPDGTKKDIFLDHIRSDTETDYWFEEPLGESPSTAQTGDYIFTVTDNEGNTASITDNFHLAPLDRMTHLAPITGAVLPVNGVMLSCAAINHAIKYRYYLYSHWGNRSAYQSEYMERNDHIVPQSEVAEDWIYRLRIAACREDPEIEDIDNRSVSHDKWGHQNYFFTASATPSTTNTLNFPAGTLIEDYRIAAMPLGPASPDPTSTLNITPEDYDTRYMRLGQWNTDTQGYDEYPVFSSLGPGSAFWALFREQRSIDLSGIEAPTVDHPTLTSQQACRHPIIYGWNMLGNPFPYTISIDDMVVSDTPGQYAAISEGTITQPVFWVYDHGTYRSASTLEAGEGGWLKKTTVGLGSIYFAAIPRNTDTRTESDQVTLEKPPSPPGSFGATSTGSATGGEGGCYIDAISGK